MTSLTALPETSATGPGDVSREQAAAAVSRLRATFATGRTRDAAWRLRQLEAIERLVNERESEIADALAADLGRNAHYSWLGDIAPVAAEASFARKHLRKWMRPRRTTLPVSMQPGTAWYQHEPLGVVMVIGPWNYPVYLTLGPIVGAVAAGNCVVVKPSEHAPASSALLARLLPQYLDPEAVTVLEGAAATTQHLLDQGLDHVLFTGGSEIGKLVMEGAAKHLTPVTLELGGKSPAIVTADADLEVTARRIAWTKLLNSGQTCIAPDYVLVEEPVRDELVDRIRTTVQQFAALEPGHRAVNERQFDRLAGLLHAHGGRIALGGGTDREGLAIEPTIVVDPDRESELMSQEIFGPILPVLTVGSVDEAIRFVNAGPKPLAAYLFTSSQQTKDRMLAEMPSGGAVINHLMMHCLVPQLPFGGVGYSGMGAYHGRWGFETFSHRKSVLSKPARPDPSLMYPPYNFLKRAVLRRFF